MFEIYTDASVYKGKGVSACIILSTEAFIGYNVSSYEHVSSSLHGELLGILDGIRYAKRCSKNECISAVLYSDSNSAVSILNNQKEEPSFNRKLVSEIRQECVGCDITFTVIRGHQPSHNPNKIVDLTSNTVLRYLAQTEVDK